MILVACSEPKPIDPQLAARAKAAIEAERPVRGQVGFRDLWADKYGDLICGRISAPPGLKEDTLRFVYEDRTHHGQVEYHELWIGGAAGMAAVEANRSLFNRLWDMSCAPTEPGQWPRFFR